MRSLGFNRKGQSHAMTCQFGSDGDGVACNNFSELSDKKCHFFHLFIIHICSAPVFRRQFYFCLQYYVCWLYYYNLLYVFRAITCNFLIVYPTTFYIVVGFFMYVKWDFIMNFIIWQLLIVFVYAPYVFGFSFMTKKKLCMYIDVVFVNN